MRAGRSIAVVTATGSLADATRAVLLGVRLRAVATAEEVQTSVDAQGVDVDDLAALVGQLERAGLLEHRDGRFPGWRLTDDGRAEGERLLGLELDELNARAAVRGAYERFLALNGVLLRVCTDWQLLDADPSSLVVNDHSDVARDRALLARLRAVHDRVVPICAGLAALVTRFMVYEPRFAEALAILEAGELDTFHAGDIDSYHATWFELHDHLLATLGIDRSTEPLPDTSAEAGPS